MGANLRATGEVIFAGSGLSRFGFIESASDIARLLLDRAVDALKKSRFDAEVTDSIEQRIWEKLIINAGINALTAIHDLANGRLLDDPAITATMQAATAEAENVARALGVILADDSFTKTVAVCQATAANVSSMLQDIRRHRRTEIDAINGAIVRLGEKMGVDVPVNRRLTEQVKTIERSYL